MHASLTNLFFFWQSSPTPSIIPWKTDPVTQRPQQVHQPARPTLTLTQTLIPILTLHPNPTLTLTLTLILTLTLTLILS